MGVLTMSDCFLCGKPKEGWDSLSLKLLLENFKLCKKCREFAETEISKQPLSENRVVEPTQPLEPPSAVTKEFLPPIPDKPFKDYTERQPGEEG